jgi:hypothetical protein
MGKAYSIGLFVVSVVVLLSWNYWRVSGPADMPSSPPPAGPGPAASMSYPLAAQLVITAVLLVAALFVILTKRYPAQDKHWAYGALGTVVGFWLKAPGV